MGLGLVTLSLFWAAARLLLLLGAAEEAVEEAVFCCSGSVSCTINARQLTSFRNLNIL